MIATDLDVQSTEITKIQLLILTIAAGICVANIYYSQPILVNIAQYFNIAESNAAYLPFYSQAGYGLGLILLTPLGDKLDRKKLIVFFQGVLILTLTGVVLIKDFTWLLVLHFMIGFFATATQIIMPLAAALSGSKRGKVVGTVFTGILIGVLGARTLSGFVANYWGWQWIYGLSAALLLLSNFLIFRFLPSRNGTYLGSYFSLIVSSVSQLKQHALLRKHTLLAFFVFGAFSSFWTTLTLHMSSPPFNYNSSQIGLFGILGIGAALAAPLIGKMSDTKSPAILQSRIIFSVIVTVVLMALLPTYLWALIIGVIILDIGVQSSQVINVAQIYTLDPSAHSRINTIFMTFTFIGGAIGTVAGLQAWKLGEWNGVCLQLGIWLGIGLVLSIFYKIPSKMLQKEN